MKVLLTGGSGFLGREFIQQALLNNISVVALTRARVLPAAAGLDWSAGDINDVLSLAAIRSKYGPFDSLVHLAALVPRQIVDDQLNPMVRANIEGTMNVLEVFGTHVGSIVYGSTAEVYGFPDGEDPIDECYPTHPSSYYGATKLAAETLCACFGQKQSVPVSSLRFSVMYGGDDAILRAIPNFIRRALRNEDLEVFGGEERRDYLHVRDAAASIVCAVQRPSTGVYNIATGHGVSIHDAAHCIVRLCGSDSRIKVLPRTKKSAHMVFSVSSAADVLGFRARYAFPEGIEDQIQLQREHVKAR
jgi:UDP-glucose 4-epimerase